MKNKLNNAHIFITGANGGIGKEVVKILTERNVESIALACRTKEKAEKVKSKLQPKNTVLSTYGGFDMNNENSIKRAVDQLPDEKPFDIVFLQSGGMIVSNDFQFIESKKGRIEKTIYQNTFGGYLTLKYLLKRNLITKNARVVFPGGEGARGIKGLIKAPFFRSTEELNHYIQYGSENYKDLEALGASKFMSGLLVQKLASIDVQREYVWFSPGLTAGTNGLNKVPNPKKFIMEKIGFPFMTIIGLAQRPKQAAEKYVECLSGKYGDSGDLIGAPEGKALGKLVDQKPLNPGLTNYQFIDAFWGITTTVCGESPF